MQNKKNNNPAQLSPAEAPEAIRQAFQLLDAACRSGHPIFTKKALTCSQQTAKKNLVSAKNRLYIGISLFPT